MTAGLEPYPWAQIVREADQLERHRDRVLVATEARSRELQSNRVVLVEDRGVTFELVYVEGRLVEKRTVVPAGPVRAPRLLGRVA